MDFGALNGSVMRAFGEPGGFLYTPAANGSIPASLPFPVAGIFDRWTEEVPDPNGGAPTTVRKASMAVAEADFPTGHRHRKRDQLLARGDIYDVTAAEPDGHGWVILHLGIVR